MSKRVGWDYGYRSGCCFAPIRAGRKRIKDSKQTVLIWVCTRCKKRDVVLLDLNRTIASQSSENEEISGHFIPDEDDDFRE